MTLGLACVFAALLVRSLTFEDELAIPTGKRSQIWLSTKAGYVMCMSAEFDSDNWAKPRPELMTLPIDANGRDFFQQFDDFYSWTVRGDEIGFGKRPRIQGDVSAISVTYASYRFVILPLTLLSAYLLLSKPRPAKKPEPAPAAGESNA